MTQATSTQPTMEDLLNRVSGFNEVEVGQTVSGKIIFLAKNEAILDIENLGLGIVRGRELYNEEYLSHLKVGESVEAIVLDPDNERGMVELSFRAIGKDKIWSEIKEMYEQQKTVDGKIRDANRGGFLVRVHGVDGFLPASLLSPAHAIKQVGNTEESSLVNQMKKYVGQTFSLKIISINPDNETVILSEKAISDEIAQTKLDKYKIGDIVDGIVVGVVDFGVFVRFDEHLEGLVHVSELAWKKVEDPAKEYKMGDKIKAKIIEIENGNRFNLSIKQTLPNPWIDFAKNTKPGDKFVGKIVKIVTYGAIVVNDQDIQGLCHITQMTKEPLDSPAAIHDLLTVGETKEFNILEVSADEKLYLTLLDLETAKQIQLTAHEEAQDVANQKNEEVSEVDKEQ
jgi:ribosomal protein S1